MNVIDCIDEMGELYKGNCSNVNKYDMALLIYIQMKDFGLYISNDNIPSATQRPFFLHCIRIILHTFHIHCSYGTSIPFWGHNSDTTLLSQEAKITFVFLS